MLVSVNLSRKANRERWPNTPALSLDLEDYIKYVVSPEIGASAPLEAQKAQAVAARSYAVAAILGGAQTVKDTSSFQVFEWREDAKIARAIQAVRETAGEALWYNGKVANGWYSDSNGGHTSSAAEVWGSERAWTASKDDPWDAAVGKPRNGHGVGMSQNGAIYAAKQGIGYREILAFYFPGAEIKPYQEDSAPAQIQNPPKVSKPATQKPIPGKTAGDAFADWAEKQVGNAYWYGTYGQQCSESLWAGKSKQYPNHCTTKRTPRAQEQISQGKKAFDCVGLIKGYLWSAKGKGKLSYGTNGVRDTTANGMFKQCKRTGAIATIPEERGLLVWNDGHIGVYVGSGYAVEARGFDYGVVKTVVKERNWTHWAECPWVSTREGAIADVPSTVDEVTDTEPLVIPPAFWAGTVKTAHSGYIQLWKDHSKTHDVCRVNDGETVHVLEAAMVGMVLANYGQYVGLADAQYLIDRHDVAQPEYIPPEEQPSEDPVTAQVLESVGRMQAELERIVQLIGGGRDDD